MSEEAPMILGRLVAQIDALSETVKEHRQESRERGSKLLEDVEAVKLESSHVKRSVEDLKAWKDAISPELATLQKWRERGIGAWMVIVFLSGFVGAVFVTAWKWIAVKLGLSG